MKTQKLIDAQMLSLMRHLNHPLLRRKFALFLGRERWEELMADPDELFVPIDQPGRLREKDEPAWAADNGDGSGYGPIGWYRGFYVFLHDDPHACHFQAMEPF